jgi:hypothetical protein
MEIADAKLDNPGAFAVAMNVGVKHIMQILSARVVGLELTWF